MTFHDILETAVHRLKPTSPTALLDAQLLLEHVSHHDRAWLLAHGGETTDEATLMRFVELLERRVAGEPVAYIIGSVGFCGREFVVNPAVLVPRPESEHLLEAAVADVRARGEAAPRVADIGTGSGALAITLAHELPEASVYAVDVTPEALGVARENAQRLGVAERVTFLEGDLAGPLAPFAPLTCVVANLPYVKSGDVPVRPNPVGYEPRVALDGGRDGLTLYRRLVRQLLPLMEPGGSMFFEAAPDTVERLAELVEHTFRGAYVEIGEDYGGCERYVAATVSPDSRR